MPDSSAEILIVDDIEQNRLVLKDFITVMGHASVLAADGAAGLEQMERKPPDLVLLDILMPRMDGLQVLDRMKRHPKLRRIPVIMITAVDEVATVARCIERGADDYLVKPFNPTLLKARVQGCLEKYRLIKAEQELLEKTLRRTIGSLTDILAMVSPEAFARATRVRRLVRDLANYLEADKVWQLEIAAMLSQIGCVTVPTEILQRAAKGERLTPEEAKMVATHPRIARDLIVSIPRLGKIAQIVGCQNVDYDGRHTPYPNLKGDAIPFGARLLHVAIDYDALLTANWKPMDALGKIHDSEGKYDPAIVNALVKLKAAGIDAEQSGVGVFGLRPGMILEQDVITNTGFLLASKGQEVTESLRARLINWTHSAQIVEPIEVSLPKP